MRQQEDITIQSLAKNEDVQIGYSDNDIVVVDSIQKFAEVKAAHVAMNAVVICTSGKIQAEVNGHTMQLSKNQVAIFPQNLVVTNMMVSPDFDMKGLFLTNRILRSFLREKINVWNDMMYIRRLHIITMEEEDMVFYTHFYDMLFLVIERGHDHPFHTEVIQSLLRATILGLCGGMKAILHSSESFRQPAANGDYQAAADDSEPHQQEEAWRGLPEETGRGLTHFQRFLDLLNSSEVKRHSVEAYAAELCISPKYLTAICKKHSGKTANEWIREHILEDIRYNLKQTDLSIKEISQRLGFPNTSFFGKYVKEHFGMTPMQVRRK